MASVKTIVHPVRLDVPSSIRMEAGPIFDFTDTEDRVGNLQSNSNWQYALWGYTLRFVNNSANFRAIQGFWLGRRGKAFGFFLKDWVDYKDEGAGKVRLINGVYRIVKEYPDMGNYNPYKRLITAPVNGTVVLSGVSGSGLSIDYNTGIVNNASSEGTATFQFDVPCKFFNNSCRPTYQPADEGNEATDWVNVEIREVRSYTIAGS